MKKSIFLTIVSLGLFFLGCEKNFDDKVNKENAILDFTSKRVTIETIPEIMSFIERNMKSQVYKFKTSGKVSLDSPKMIFDKTSAIEVIEKDNTKKYTFTFRYDNTPESVFYNLVINVSLNGEKSSYVMRFTCDKSQFVEYKDHNYNFNYFHGKMDIFKTSTFFNTSINTNKTATTDPNCPDPVDQYGDPIPQVTTPISGGSTGGSTSGGGISGGTTSSGGGTGGGCTVTTYTISCWCRGDLVGVHNHSEPVIYYYVACFTNKINSTSIDCPELSIPNGVIGAIDTDPLLFVKYLKPVLPLTNNQFVWLRIRPGLAATLYSYLLGNDQTAEAKAFEIEVIDKMIAQPNVFTTIAPFLIEKIIDDTQLNPCAKGVFTTVRNTTNCDIAQVLAKLDANGSLYNTIIKSEVPNNGNPSTTFRTSRFNYTIQISTNYAGKTKLFIASSLMHELVHAYFLNIVDDYNSNPNNDQNLYNLNSFPSLFQAYCDSKFPPAQGISQNLHHLEMANYYVDAIAKALQEYQTGTPVAAGSSPQQIYSDLAWGGLNGTPVFNATYPEGNPNRQRIINRVACEQNGTSIGYGTPDLQNPIGNPCN